jgi:hypothetical protein
VLNPIAVAGERLRAIEFVDGRIEVVMGFAKLAWHDNPAAVLVLFSEFRAEIITVDPEIRLSGLYICQEAYTLSQ